MGSMESSFSVSHWDYLVLLILRPVLAICFVLVLISLGWLMAWKAVLVHVPLVQEIYGLRKKKHVQIINKNPRRFSQYYKSINSRNSESGVNKFGSAGD